MDDTKTAGKDSELSCCGVAENAGMNPVGGIIPIAEGAGDMVTGKMDVMIESGKCAVECHQGVI